jgi:hypothetical protein
MIKRTIVLLAISVTATTALAYFIHTHLATPDTEKAHAGAAAAYNPAASLHTRASALKTYAANNGYETSICFMVNMKAASGKKRFFVYNLQKDSIEKAGLVTHGSGSDKESGELFFSNKPGSLCTSLGRYKIGQQYNGQFGLAYKLHGLDASNSNAFARAVVLHAHGCVPMSETAPDPICVSWGCPTVAPDFLQQLKQYITKAAKPILLEIYY